MERCAGCRVAGDSAATPPGALKPATDKLGHDMIMLPSRRVEIPTHVPRPTLDESTLGLQPDMGMSFAD